MHISAHEQQQPPQQPPVSQYARQLSQPNAMMPPAAPPPPTNDKVGPGWVPKNYLERVSAIYDYSADKDDELRYVKIICFWFKGWNQLHHQPVLKFPLFLPAG